MFDAIEPDGVRMPDGTRWPADVILWATGFRPAVGHLGPLHLQSRVRRHPARRHDRGRRPARAAGRLRPLGQHHRRQPRRPGRRPRSSRTGSDRIGRSDARAWPPAPDGRAGRPARRSCRSARSGTRRAPGRAVRRGARPRPTGRGRAGAGRRPRGGWSSSRRGGTPPVAAPRRPRRSGRGRPGRRGPARTTPRRRAAPGRRTDPSRTPRSRSSRSPSSSMSRSARPGRSSGSRRGCCLKRSSTQAWNRVPNRAARLGGRGIGLASSWANASASSCRRSSAVADRLPGSGTAISALRSDRASTRSRSSSASQSATRALSIMSRASSSAAGVGGPHHRGRVEPPLRLRADAGGWPGPRGVLGGVGVGVALDRRVAPVGRRSRPTPRAARGRGPGRPTDRTGVSRGLQQNDVTESECAARVTAT